MEAKNKIEHVWSVLCQSSAIDYETNELSLFKVVEEIGIQIEVKDEEGKKELEKLDSEGAVFPIALQLVSVWQQAEKLSEDSEVFKVRIDVIDPKGKKNGTFDYEFKIPASKIRMRNRVNFNSLKVTTSGRYVLKISLLNPKSQEFENVGNVPLDVTVKRS